MNRDEIKAKIEADFGRPVNHLEGDSYYPKTGHVRYTFTMGAPNAAIPVHGEVIVSPTAEFSQYRVRQTPVNEKFKIILMNSAMMPAPGTYDCYYLTKEGFRAIYSLYKKSGLKFENRIGYTETINHLQEITGDRYTPNREETKLNDGDVMLVIKLPYRPKDPDNKSQIKPEEFSYSVIKYYRR